MRAIPLERNFFKTGRVLVLACTAFDGALDIVLGHVFVARLIHGEAQAEVGIGITAAFAGRHDDLARETREDRAALGIGRPLFSFDGGPFGMTGHTSSWL